MTDRDTYNITITDSRGTRQTPVRTDGDPTDLVIIVSWLDLLGDLIRFRRPRILVRVAPTTVGAVTHD
jgi:hypothetical protein